ARDLLAELEFVAEGGSESVPVAPIAAATRKRVWLNRVMLAASGLVAGAAVASAALYLRGSAVGDELRVRVPIQLTAESTVAGGRGNNPGVAQGYQGVSGTGVFNPSNFAISPDGRSVAFVSRQTVNDTWFLYVRPVNAVTPQRLAGTE